MSLSPFDFANAIGQDKKDIIRDETGTNEKAYNSFMVNRTFSMHPDTILLANEINARGLKFHGVDNIRHHDFLINTVAKRKRYGKWPKADKSVHVELIMKRYGYSKVKALEVLTIFTDDQLKALEESMAEGGRKK